jgi:hypothetical protein
MLMAPPPAYHLVLQQLPSAHEAPHAPGKPTEAPAEAAPQRPELSELRYQVVGSGKEVWLVHVLSRAPDFDQVVRVSLDTPLARKGTDLPVLRFSGRKNLVDERLKAGEQLTATGQEGQPVRLTVQREHSLLKGPDFTP